jgi:DNA-directed RNA polymerase specialized sigma24 family protein
MAPELDRSPDAVRKLWYRALERLQQELVEDASGRPSPPAGPE